MITRIKDILLPEDGGITVLKKTSRYIFIRSFKKVYIINKSKTILNLDLEKTPTFATASVKYLKDTKQIRLVIEQIGLRYKKKNKKEDFDGECDSFIAELVTEYNEPK